VQVPMEEFALLVAWHWEMLPPPALAALRARRFVAVAAEADPFDEPSAGEWDGDFREIRLYRRAFVTAAVHGPARGDVEAVREDLERLIERALRGAAERILGGPLEELATVG